MSDEYYSYDEEEGEGRQGGGLFIWTVFILLLIGLAFACWLGSFYIFGHPEEPRPYRILQKLNKLDPPKRFDKLQAPNGEFLSPQKLFERYSAFSRLELERENALLFRDYIKNYRETKKLVPYIAGRFDVMDVTELKPTDAFSPGVVVIAQATDYPQVIVENVFTCAQQNVANLKAMLETGLDMQLERTRDLSAVVHIERTFDGRLKFTAMPLLYGTWALRNSVGTFSLEPPKDINIEAGLPVINAEELKAANQKYADFRRTRPVAPLPEDSTEVAPSGPELVRLDALPPGATAPETGAMPEVPVATPIPVSGRVVRPTSTPARVVAAAAATPTPRPRPVATPPLVVANIPAATPSPTLPITPTPPTSADGVPLKPFIASAPAPSMQTTSPSSWRVHSPGQQPAGRTIQPSEASALADKGAFGERLYLAGSFVVTASGENRAVLRSLNATGDPSQPGSGSARVIVEYPASAAPPTEGATFARDASRAFEIRDVRRGADGQINVYVREVTAPQVAGPE